MNFSKITHNLWLWPSLKQLMLQLSGPAPLGTDIIPNEFEFSKEDVSLLEAQGQAIGHAYAKLASHVKEG